MNLRALLTGLSVVCAVGCGTPTDNEMMNPDVLGPDGNNPNVEYPNGDIGYKVGQQIRNLAFLWHPNGVADKGTEPQRITMADFYAMRKTGTKLVYLSGAAEWCGPCNVEAQDLVKILAGKVYFNKTDSTSPYCGGTVEKPTFCADCKDNAGQPAACPNFPEYLKTKGGPEAVKLVQVIMQNADYSPSDKATIDRWEARHNATFSVGIDPKMQVQEYIPQQSIPQSIFFRTDTMAMTNKLVGAPPTYELMLLIKSELDKVTR